MFESIFAPITGVAGESTFNAATLAAALGTSFVLGLLISFVYIKTCGKRQSTSFAVALVLLPAVIAVIILLVGNNVARAFSLAGAFAIIRFRSAPGEPKDITHVLFCMVVGLAAGMGFLLYAVIAGIAFCAVTVVLELIGYGKVKGERKLLKITVPEDLNFGGAFDDVLSRYAANFKLNRVKTADLGSVYELTYALNLKDGISEKSFIDELRVRNGNMNIALILDAPNTPYTAEF